MPNICVVDDDLVMGESLRKRLSIEGYRVDLYDCAGKAYRGIQSEGCDIMLCDTSLPDMNGLEFYQKLRDEQCIVPPTIFMAAHASIEHVVRILKLGAIDYINKPFNADKLVSKLNTIAMTLPSDKTDQYKYCLGISPAMMAVQKHLRRLAQYHDTPLLITGESGVGKEIAAKYLHERQKNNGCFMAINCAAIPENLFESELFGYEKGAFTGAYKSKKGVFEQVGCGSLLLDEIGEMPHFVQSKLLRVLEERKIRRVGGEKEITVSARLIFATNKNLEQQVSEGLFREDLFYRINVIHASIPALRDRQEDILWFADEFLNLHARRYSKYNLKLDASAEAALLKHHWPGNIRELKNTIERACIMANQVIISAEDIFPSQRREERYFGTSSVSLKEYLENLEKEKIQSVFLSHNENINETAKYLNISRKTLWEKMRKYKIRKSNVHSK